MAELGGSGSGSLVRLAAVRVLAGGVAGWSSASLRELEDLLPSWLPLFPVVSSICC